MNFGNFILASLSGEKFNDLTGSGIQEPNDPGLAGITVFIDLKGTGIFAPGDPSTVTGVNGTYTFTGLDPGTYSVLEVEPAGSIQTTPNPSGITVTSGGSFIGVNFGNFILASLSGEKFNDLTGSGIQEPNDPGLAGIKIFIDLNGTGIYEPNDPSVITGLNGTYTFTGLAPGTYTVREVEPAGSIQTTTNPVGITVTSGGSFTGVNFGNFKLISIHGLKFDDLSGSGILVPGEPAVAGVTIFVDLLHNGILEPGDPTTTTGVDGSYNFFNLGPGTYTIREVEPAGWMQTSVNPKAITASSGSNVTGVRFGNFKLISIHGLKFDDLGGSGVLVPGEPALAGVTIFIDLKHNGILEPGDPTTTTGFDGSYNFFNLGPGTYTIREVEPAGWMRTSVNPAAITASSGSNVAGVRFGNFKLISINGFKYNDLGGNGILKPGDPGLAGVTIFMDLYNNGILEPADPRTTTNANGYFSFPNVGPGTYTIREVEPAGWMQTSANPAAIKASSGSNVSGITIGNFKLFSISGTKYEDLNGSGVLQPGDPGLPGITIFLDLSHNGILEPADPRTTTNANGYFSFSNLGPGTYFVRELVPLGWIEMTNNTPAIAASSGVNVSNILIGDMSVSNLMSPSKLLLIGSNMSNMLNGNTEMEAAFVANLYESLLGIAPNLAGLEYFFQLLLAGYSEQQVTALFDADFGV